MKPVVRDSPALFGATGVPAQNTISCVPMRTRSPSCSTCTPLHAVAPDLHTVARSEILDRRSLADDANSRVLARNEWIFDRDLTGRASTQ